MVKPVFLPVLPVWRQFVSVCTRSTTAKLVVASHPWITVLPLFVQHNKIWPLQFLLSFLLGQERNRT